MEGFFAALVVSGAAVVTARNQRTRQSRVQRAIRVLTLVAALLGLGALCVGFALREWLTVSWAFGLTSCCLALGVPLGFANWPERIATVVVLTLSAVGVVLCVQGLATNAPWVISQAFAHVTYRTRPQWVILGNCVLNLTALLIVARRVS